jgi:hypothetical protein
MTIQFSTFLENFTVRVVEYEPQGESIVTVHFEVRSNYNGRLSIHLASVDTSNLGEHTTNDVLNIAWDIVKPTVSAWATTNVVNEPLTSYVPSDTTDAINITDFNDNFDVRVARWELYPTEKPQHWCIGFEARKKSGTQNIIKDCNISITSFCNNTLCLDIMNAAWAVMKPSICSWASQVLASFDVINSIYVPTTLT